MDYKHRCTLGLVSFYDSFRIFLEGFISVFLLLAIVLWLCCRCSPVVCFDRVTIFTDECAKGECTMGEVMVSFFLCFLCLGWNGRAHLVTKWCQVYMSYCFSVCVCIIFFSFFWFKKINLCLNCQRVCPFVHQLAFLVEWLLNAQTNRSL